MGPKREHIVDQRTFPKDMKEILISDKYNKEEVNDEEDESDNECDSEFPRTERELIQKNICKFLKNS